MSSIPQAPSPVADSAVAIQGSHLDVMEQLLDGRSRWDQRLIRWSNWFNPILVKETRQALKSKQFSWTFGLLVIVVLVWSMLCILGTIPNIYYASDGRTLLCGYILILVVPAFLIIPQSAFRSMASELDDGTFETLSLSMLKPRHILFGKLNVSALQLMIYMSVVAPCIALTYLLRGVTLELILFVFLVVSLTTMCLSVVAISLAAFSRSRLLQVIFSLLLIGLQLIVAFMISSVLIGIAQTGIGGDAIGDAESVWVIFTVVAGISTLYSWLLFACAAGMIGVSSENKSTPIRVPLLVIGILLPAIGILLNAFFSPSGDQRTLASAQAVTISLLGLHWAVAGSFLVGERGFISIRAKRTLPQNLLSRLLLTWMIPGPGTGYIFVLLSFVGTVITFIAYLIVAQVPASSVFEFSWFAIAMCCYLALYLGVTRLLSMVFLSRMVGGRMVATFALLIVLNVIAVVTSCSISLWMNDYLRMDYDWYCFINPWWTLGETFPNSYSRRGTTPEIAIAILALCTVPVFLLNLLLSAKDIVIQRLETPKRVTEERARISGKNSAKELEVEPEVDPLA